MRRRGLGAGCCQRWNREPAIWTCDNSRSGASRGRGLLRACGYQGHLLLQFVPPARRDEVAPLFADFALLETQWQSIPQLWVQTTGVDSTLTNRIRGRQGVHAQWVMDKDLNPPAADASRSGATGPQGSGPGELRAMSIMR